MTKIPAAPHLRGRSDGGGLPLEPDDDPESQVFGGCAGDGGGLSGPTPLPYDPDVHDVGEAFLRSAPRQFSEVPSAVWGRPGWVTVHASRVMGTHNILALEGEALHRAFKHALRSIRTHGRKVLFLVDNLPLAMATAKGRAKSPLLTRVLLKIAALSLATGTRAVVRWIPSEFNAADDGSRGKVGFFASPAVGGGPDLGDTLGSGPPGLLDGVGADECLEPPVGALAGSPAAPPGEPATNADGRVRRDELGRASEPWRPRSGFVVPLRLADSHRVKAMAGRPRNGDGPTVDERGDGVSPQPPKRGDRRTRRARPRPLPAAPPAPESRRLFELYSGLEPSATPSSDASDGSAGARDRDDGPPRRQLGRRTRGGPVLVPVSTIQPSGPPDAVGDSDGIACKQRALQKKFRTARNGACAARYRIFLEPFGGSQGLGPALRKRGYGVLSLDPAEGPVGDALDPAVSNAIRGWLTGGALVGVWLSPPCGTWSMDSTPIRNLAHLWGLPGQPPATQAKIERGSAALRFSMELIRECRRRHVPVFLEHPRHSLMWQVPELKALGGLPDARAFDYDACQYGAKWRKGTTIVSWGVHDFAPPVKRCTGHGGKCSRTGARHIRLSGQVPTGPLRSPLASAKPTELAQELAAGFDNVIRDRRSSKLHRLVMGSA